MFVYLLWLGLAKFAGRVRVGTPVESSAVRASLLSRPMRAKGAQRARGESRAVGVGEGLSGLFCSMVGLLAWPVWSMGVLPSLNGASLHEPRTVVATLERTEATAKRRSRELNYWAWLVPQEGVGLAAGRYVIREALHERLAAEAPATLEVEAATGMLGAVVVLAIRQEAGGVRWKHTLRWGGRGVWTGDP